MQEQDNGNTSLSQTEILDLEKLSKKHPIVNKLYTLYLEYASDPANEARAILYTAQKEIRMNQQAKSLNFEDDKNQKALWEILKGGAAMVKSLTSLKEKGVAQPEQKMQESAPEQEMKVIPITPETAKK